MVYTRTIIHLSVCYQLSKAHKIAVIIFVQTNGIDCQRAGYGHFSAGINHCKTNSGGGDGCKRVVTGVDYGCGQYHQSCSEPLCCGASCQGPDSCDSGNAKYVKLSLLYITHGTKVFHGNRK